MNYRNYYKFPDLVRRELWKIKRHLLTEKLLSVFAVLGRHWGLVDCHFAIQLLPNSINILGVVSNVA